MFVEDYPARAEEDFHGMTITIPKTRFNVRSDHARKFNSSLSFARKDRGLRTKTDAQQRSSPAKLTHNSHSASKANLEEADRSPQNVRKPVSQPTKPCYTSTNRSLLLGDDDEEATVGDDTSADPLFDADDNTSIEESRHIKDESPLDENRNID